jgi:hypothetical protein
MNKKLIIVLVLVVFIGLIGYFIFFKSTLIGYRIFLNKFTPYQTKEKCEQATGKECHLFQGLCQIEEAQNPDEVEANEKFLKECLSKIGTWQPVDTISTN